MRRHPAPWLILTLASISGLGAPDGVRAAGELRALGLLEAGDHTRVELTLARQPDYKVFTLDNPHRLVLDLKGAELGAGFAPGPATGVVLGVRTGRPEPGQLRVVLDLVEGVQPRSYLIPPGQGGGHRLVVELHAATTTGQRAGPAANGKPRTVEDIVQNQQRDLIIAIDAGHGGQDPGARGPAGTWEKNITLAVSRELAKKIDAEPGMKAVLIRDGDYFIPLQQRYRKAREARADLFVSIHADAFHKPTAAGASVFVLSQRGASSEAARWLADRENAADLVGGVKLDDKDNTLAAVLLDLSQSATMKASEDVANNVLNALKRVGKTHKPQVERANFVVLRSPDVPSMLIETAFISNPGEEKKLNDPVYRRRLAEAIRDGVRDYFYAQPPPGTWIAANADRHRGGVREHIVARGDTLSSIAARHGVTVAQLRGANRLQGDVVRIGQRLSIPAATAATGGSVTSTSVGAASTR